MIAALRAGRWAPGPPPAMARVSADPPRPSTGSMAAAQWGQPGWLRSADAGPSDTRTSAGLRSIGQELCGLLLQRDLSGAFSHSWTGITGSGRTTTEIKLLSSHHSKGTSYQHDLSLLMLTLTTWLRFLQYQVTLLSPFHTALFGRKSLCTARI